MSVVRKGVLLRFDPDLLARVDQTKGGLKRTEYLMSLIEEGVAAREAPSPVPASHPMAGAMTSRGRIPIIGEDGEEMGISGQRREDGVIEFDAGEPVSEFEGEAL